LLIYLIGDNDNNLFISDLDIFLVDNTLFITFLLLFVKNLEEQKPIQFSEIFCYLIPAIAYSCIEVYELAFGETETIERIEHLLYLIFVIYLIRAFFYTLQLSVSALVKTPFYLLIISLLINYSSLFFSFDMFEIKKMHAALIFVIAFVFYYLTYLFVLNYDFISKQQQVNKYKNSSLNPKDIESYKKRIIEAMETDKVFTDKNLSLQTFSEKVNIPKHFISEILNIHLKTNFQDFVNEYRVEEFIQLYSNPDNDHFSILGIATSAGFKNKATFNANFKKFKGVSPTEYRQQHQNSHTI
jgi:AraC-like DNA-binding protein